MTTDNIAMWVIRHSIVDWDCSKTQTLLESLNIPDQLRENLVYLRKSNIRSDAGLRMDGTPVLDLWDMVTEVLHSSTNYLARGNPSQDETNVPTRRPVAR